MSNQSIMFMVMKLKASYMFNWSVCSFLSGEGPDLKNYSLSSHWTLFWQPQFQARPVDGAIDRHSVIFGDWVWLCYPLDWRVRWGIWGFSKGS